MTQHKHHGAVIDRPSGAQRLIGEGTSQHRKGVQQSQVSTIKA